MPLSPTLPGAEMGHFSRYFPQYLDDARLGEFQPIYRLILSDIRFKI